MDCDEFTICIIPVMSDFISAPVIPVINTAEVVASISVVTIKCPCIKHTIIMGQMGQPLVCIFCKRVWWVSAKAQVTIQEVLGDLTKQESSMLFNG